MCVASPQPGRVNILHFWHHPHRVSPLAKIIWIDLTRTGMIYNFLFFFLFILLALIICSLLLWFVCMTTCFGLSLAVQSQMAPPQRWGGDPGFGRCLHRVGLCCSTPFTQRNPPDVQEEALCNTPRKHKLSTPSHCDHYFWMTGCCLDWFLFHIPRPVAVHPELPCSNLSWILMHGDEHSRISSQERNSLLHHNVALSLCSS